MDALLQSPRTLQRLVATLHMAHVCTSLPKLALQVGVRVLLRLAPSPCVCTPALCVHTGLCQPAQACCWGLIYQGPWRCTRCQSNEGHSAREPTHCPCLLRLLF